MARYLYYLILISFVEFIYLLIYLYNLIVSYHGTAKHNCKSIAEEGYLLCKGKRFAFGRGIYSTPDIDVATNYATEFNYKGDNYRVVFQNRNNLYRIPKEETGEGEYCIFFIQIFINVLKCLRDCVSNFDQ